VPAPLVSCIVPVFNGVHDVMRALDSIFAQAHRPLEVIVVDDGSTDETGAVIAAYGEHVRYVRQENAGPAAARNRGIRAARGALIAFLDQDDRWHPDKLAHQLTAFASRPSTDACVGHVESVWDDDTPRQADQPRAGVVPGYVTGTLLARREVFDRVGLFDAELWFVDSLEWFSRAVDAGITIAVLPEVLLYHRVHGGNLSRRGDDSRAETLRVIKRTLDRRRAADASAEDETPPRPPRTS
jgi:glycosyltransferase involved in cell wall biosynthesis